MFLIPTVEHLLQEINDNIRGRPNQEGQMFLMPYNAYSSKTSIAHWIREAEIIAELNSLSDDDLKEFIGSSLSGSSLKLYRTALFLRLCVNKIYLFFCLKKKTDFYPPKRKWMAVRGASKWAFHSSELYCNSITISGFKKRISA